MSVSGVRARRFIQPAGGASAIFQRQRGMVAPAPVRPLLPAADDDRNSRTGKATGRDYGNFFSRKRNVSAIKGAVNALKGLLVGTFIAAKSLGATLKNVVGQINGFVKNKGGGFLGKLGTVGIVAAVVVGVAAIFGPQIKKAFDFLKTKAEEIFQNVKSAIDGVDKKIEGFYETIRGFVNNTIIPFAERINEVLKAIEPIAGILKNLPTEIEGPFGIKIPVGMLTGPFKGIGGLIHGIASKRIPKIDPLKPYRSYVDEDGNFVQGLLGEQGLNFLGGTSSLGDLGMNLATGIGGALTGGLDSLTGVMGDFLNNFFADMGLTDKANDVLGFFGMDPSFGARRDIGSGQGVSSLVPDGMFDGLGKMFGLGGDQQQQQSGSGTPLTTSPGGLTAAQKAFLDTVSFAEGTQNSDSYNTWFSGMKFPPEQPDLSKYTINQVVALQKRFLREGYGKFNNGADASAAVGKYQMIRPETYAAAAGLNPAVDKFTPENQDKMAIYGYIMGQGKVTEAEINAPEISDRTIDKLAPVFASYPNLFGPGDKGRAPGDGVSYYGGQGAKTKRQIQERYRQNRSRMSAPAAPAAAPAPKAQSARDAFIPPPRSKASNMIMPGAMNIASAPQRPRPDVAPENVSGSDGNPSYTHHSSTYFDPSTLSTLVAVG